MKSDNCPDTFSQTIANAIESLKNENIDVGYKLISEALLLDPDAPEPHNLLGILAELKGDYSVARRHYRAAYALDPAYKPACMNLERLVIFEWEPHGRDYIYGNEGDKEKKKGQKAESGLKDRLVTVDTEEQ